LLDIYIDVSRSGLRIRILSGADSHMQTFITQASRGYARAQAARIAFIALAVLSIQPGMIATADGSPRARGAQRESTPQRSGGSQPPDFFNVMDRAGDRVSESLAQSTPEPSINGAVMCLAGCPTLLATNSIVVTLQSYEVMTSTSLVETATLPSAITSPTRVAVSELVDCIAGCASSHTTGPSLRTIETVPHRMHAKLGASKKVATHASPRGAKHRTKKRYWAVAAKGLRRS
jgi:hypothetical protein